MTVAVDADSGQDEVPFRHVLAADLGCLGSRRLLIRHRRRRDRPLAVARAIRPGHTRARTQRGWLEDVAQHPAMVQRRADAQRNIMAVARVLAVHADWETFTTRPTWAVLMERTGLSRAAVAAHLAWLRSVGLLGLVAGGTTNDLSPGVLQLGAPEPDRNDAAVYVLCAPQQLRLVATAHPEDVGAEFIDDGRDQEQDEPPPALVPDHPSSRVAGDKTWTPTPSRREEYPRARDHEIRNLQDPELKRPDPAWPAHQRPASRPERTAAALEARRRLPVLARISTPYVAALLREWHLAGWTLADVLAALSRRPDGAFWHHADRVRDVPGWVRHRLAAWRTDPADPTSPPGRSPSQRAQAAAAHARALARAQTERVAAHDQARLVRNDDVHRLAEAVRAALRHARATPTT